MKASPDANGFVRVERLWTLNDKTLLHFPMAPCMTTGRDANASGAPYASVACGPLLFALPIPDGKDANTPDPAANWQFALDAERDKPGCDMTVERSPMPAKWTWPLESPLRLHANAVRIDWKPTPATPLPPEPFAKNSRREPIRLVPYGCTKFRVSMFPATKRTWQSAESAKQRKGPWERAAQLGHAPCPSHLCRYIGWFKTGVFRSDCDTLRRTASQISSTAEINI